jgi:homoserine dehydrogenase
MKNNRLVKIGILGLGVVGSELVSLIRRNASRIELETGVKIEIGKVFVRSMNKPRTIDTTGLNLTTNINEIINDSSVSVICECMGGSGFEQTYEIVKTCLKQKKHVIMSSKKTLANYAEALLYYVSQNNVTLKYDATVGGGIPIAKVLENSFKGDKLTGIYGVFNATSNFIYSKMIQESQSFESALKEAQNKGYAENDPSDDVDGFDSLNKLVILTLFGTGKIVRPDWINPESFRQIDIKDMNYAAELGYTIKPVAAADLHNGHIACKVAPFLVPAANIISQTSNNFNAIVLEGENCGALAFYGQGAGAAPTASAMFDDLVGLFSKNSFVPEDNRYSRVTFDAVKDLAAKYYIRLKVKNNSGVLSKLTAIFAERGINIERVIQKEEDGENLINVVMLTDTLKPEIYKELQFQLDNSDFSFSSGYPVLL